LVNLLSHSWSVEAADSFLGGSLDWKKKDQRVVWANKACFWLVFCGIAAFIGFILQNLPYHAQTDSARQRGVFHAPDNDSTKRPDPRPERREQARSAHGRDSARR
jgi:hypothetical protein